MLLKAKKFLSNNCINSRVFTKKFRRELSEEFPQMSFLDQPADFALVLFDDQIAEKFKAPAFLSEAGKEITGREVEAFPQEEVEYSPSKLNPPVVIEPVKIGARSFQIFRDDYLPGGTKQRAAICYYKKITGEKSQKYIVYAGPSVGAAQVVIGILAREFNLKAIMFTDTHQSELKDRAAKLGVEHRTFLLPLNEIQIKAKSFCAKNNALCLPFGLDDENFRSCLIAALRAAVPESVRFSVKRLWCVIGSGTLMNVFYEVFPNAFICGVQVGKKIWRDQIQEDRTRVFISKIGFFKEARIKPPYKSVANYDAKLWEFVEKFGQNGDYVWNVS